MELRPGPFRPPGARIRLQQHRRLLLLRAHSFLSGVERKPGAQKRLFFNILGLRPGAAASHIRVPDSSSVSASNVPSAPEPNDVDRHAFCPSSSLRPNAPFQLLRTGRWRCAPGGCAHRPGLFSSSRPRRRFRNPRRDPLGSSQCSQRSAQFRDCCCENTGGSSAISSSCCTPPPLKKNNMFRGINL